MSKLTGYMAYKTRDEETFSNLVTVCKNLAQSDSTLKKLTPEQREAFIIHAPAIAFDKSIKIEFA